MDDQRQLRLEVFRELLKHNTLTSTTDAVVLKDTALMIADAFYERHPRKMKVHTIDEEDDDGR